MSPMNRDGLLGNSSGARPAVHTSRKGQLRIPLNRDGEMLFSGDNGMATAVIRASPTISPEALCSTTFDDVAS